MIIELIILLPVAVFLTSCTEPPLSLSTPIMDTATPLQNASPTAALTTTPTLNPSPTRTRTTAPPLSPIPTQTPRPVPAGKVITTRLNVRAGPGTEYAVIDQLQEGDTFYVTAKWCDLDKDTTWFLIGLDSTHCTGQRWVTGSSQYVSSQNTENLVCLVAPSKVKAGPTFGRLRLAEHLQGTLGCPLSEEISMIMAYQAFEHGFMVWRQDNRSIYAIYDDGTWEEIIDTWQEGEPEYSCPDASTPSRTPPTPRRGFGKAWCTHPETRRRLGVALHDEIGEWRLIQDFENGVMVFIRERGDKIYVLFKNSHRWVEE